MAELPQQRWEAKLSAKLTRSTADQIWSLYADYCNIHKWTALLDTCRHVEGSPEPGQIGCIRYCAGPPMKALNWEESSPRIWANEKLLHFDPVERCLSYGITESNTGFKNYVATVKVLPGDMGNEMGCVIEWSYVTDPIEGMEYEGLYSVINSTLICLAKRMEEATQA